MRLITNTNKENDRMEFLLSKHGCNASVYIASAFFSHAELLLKMVAKKCIIKLIVRLDIGTSPDALLKIIDNPDVSIKYYTGNSFHPKFYIFENDVAYVGSSNFTKSGLQTNNEVNIELDSEELIFDDLKTTFFDYWAQAGDLTKETIVKFKEAINGKVLEFDARSIITNAIGSVEYNNVGREKPNLSKQDKFIMEFKNTYNIFINKFNKFQEIFKEANVRRFPNVPLRIEVDKFLWWLSNDHAKGDTYKDVRERSFDDIKAFAVPLIQEYGSEKNKYINADTVSDCLRIKDGFGSAEKVNNLEYDEMLEILENVNAFKARLRYFDGGLEAMKNQFKKDNPLDKVKKAIVYLLDGKDEYEFKLFQCSFGEYRLSNFGENCFKELYGLINDKNIPLYNQRVSKSLQWLGFGHL